MKHVLHLVIFITGLTLALIGCNGNGDTVRHLSHLPSDTPYQEDTIFVVLATNPGRAMVLLDSAVLLGNINEYREKFIRASIFTKSLNVQHQDSALAICEALLQHDSVRNKPENRESVLNLLINVCRGKADYNEYLRWAMEKAELCRGEGEETEQLRTEAEIGMLLTHLGQVDEGLARLDEAISQLNEPGSIDRMDAFIIAVKRKINALNDLGRYAEVIPLAQRILDRLDHYEQHAKEYAEDSYRLSWSDHPSDRDRYIDFSRAQANGFLAAAYALTDNKAKARECLDLFDQSGYGKTFGARRMIIPAQMALGMYDEAMTTCDEIVRRMAADTLNGDYATILNHRAIVARSKGHAAEAYDLMTRHAKLAKTLSDSLHASEAHDYAARYHAQEQQMEMERQDAALTRMNIYVAATAIIALLAIGFAFYFFHQRRIVSKKNRILAKQISDAIKYRDMNKEANQMDGKQISKQPCDMSNAELYDYLSKMILRERLFLDPMFSRQSLVDRFQISEKQIGAAFSKGSEFKSMPGFIREQRLLYACEMLRQYPEKSIKEVSIASGFSNQSRFTIDFKERFSMSPSDYRLNITQNE